MPEELEERRSEGTDLGQVRDIVRRRHLYFLIPLFVAWLLVWGASWVIPPRYKSSTQILVQQPSATQDYVAPNIGDDMEARLESIKQQVESSTRLLLIIDKLHLYKGAHDPAAQDAEVAQMRNDIKIDLVRDPQRNDISAFTVTYTAKDPHLAQRVTGELTDLFIGENSKARMEESVGTTSFIEKQLADASAELADEEAKVRAFESEHEGDLPTQQAGNLQILAGLQAQLQNEQSSLNTAKQQRVYLQAMIEQERNAQAKGITTGTEAPGNGGMSDLAYVNQQLATMRAQLSELSSHYTDKYPDVRALKIQIAKTEAIRDNLLAARKSEVGKPGDGDPAMSASMRQLQGQLQANQLEIANREATIEDLKNRLSGYQARLNIEPGVESQLADLTRDYDQAKANYDGLLKKRDESVLATNMEQLQQGERFTMLDPPSLPLSPDFPNHLKFCGIGVAIGLLLGFMIAGVFEFLDDRLYREKEIKALLPVPVISEVPSIVTAQDARKTKTSLVLGWTTTAVVFTVILAASLFSFMHQ